MILVYIIANLDSIAEMLLIREQNEERVKERLLAYENCLYNALKVDIIMVNDNLEKTFNELVTALSNKEYRKRIYDENVERVVRLKKEFVSVLEKETVSNIHL